MLLERHGLAWAHLLFAMTAVVATVGPGEKAAARRAAGFGIHQCGAEKDLTSAPKAREKELKMAVRSLRNVESRRKRRVGRCRAKKSSPAARASTLRARRQLKKMAGKARAAKAAAAKA